MPRDSRQTGDHGERHRHDTTETRPDRTPAVGIEGSETWASIRAIGLHPDAGNRAVARAVDRVRPTGGRRAAPATSRERQVMPVTPATPSPVGGTLQRHASFEHLLLGQIPPDDLRSIPDDRAQLNLQGGGQRVTVTQMDAYHVLRQERARVRAWQQAPPETISEGPEWDLDLVRIESTSENASTICTYGEMNMLADYFGSVDELKAAKPETVLKLLQTERDEYYKELGKLLDEFMARDFVLKRELQSTWGGLGVKEVTVKYYLPENVEDKDEYDEDDYTVREGHSRLVEQDFAGSQKYTGIGAEKANLMTMVGLEALPTGIAKGLLPKDEALANYYEQGKGTGTAWGVTARNACHFAPESWRAWEENHRKALDAAERASRLRYSASAPGTTPDEKEKWNAAADKLANEAMLYNGFGDHYLQDSFASGHLINKTLVMQWYMEEMRSWWMMGPKGLQWVRFQQMSLANQPNLAPTNYSKAPMTSQHNPQAAANVDSAEEAWDIMGLQSMDAPAPDKALFAAMRASGITNAITAAKWAQIPHGAYPAFPAPQEVERALLRLRALGLCARTSGKDDKPDKYSLLEHDVAKDATQVSTPEASLKTATANIYHEWLQNALIQAGSGALHDHFCKQGLWVSSTADSELFKIYGDDRLLTAGAGDGVEYAAQTAQMSQSNVANMLRDGNDSAAENNLQNILDRLPAYVVPVFENAAAVEKAKEFGLDKFNPPNAGRLRLDDWHNALRTYMNGSYLKSLFSTWSHHYAATVGGTLTTFNMVSPHAGDEF